MVALCEFNGAINGELFLAYVAEVLAPALTCGDIVIMDNLGSHKVSAVRQTIEATGCQAALPAALQSRSEPIEMAFAELNALLRARVPRTIEATAWNFPGAG